MLACGPLLIVRPRSQAAVPFPFGIAWPSGPNMTLDSLVSQLQATRDTQLIGDGMVLGRPCYRPRFEATPPGGRRESPAGRRAPASGRRAGF